MARLKNKTFLITGAAQGIGESIARLFVAEGAFVILTDVLDKKGKTLAKKLGREGALRSFRCEPRIRVGRADL